MAEFFRPLLQVCTFFGKRGSLPQGRSLWSSTEFSLLLAKDPPLIPVPDLPTPLAFPRSPSQPQIKHGQDVSYHLRPAPPRPGPTVSLPLLTRKRPHLNPPLKHTFGNHSWTTPFSPLKYPTLTNNFCSFHFLWQISQAHPAFPIPTISIAVQANY